MSEQTISEKQTETKTKNQNPQKRMGPKISMIPEVPELLLKKNKAPFSKKKIKSCKNGNNKRANKNKIEKGLNIQTLNSFKIYKNLTPIKPKIKRKLRIINLKNNIFDARNYVEFRNFRIKRTKSLKRLFLGSKE